MLKDNKKVYRNLGTKNIEVRELICMAELQTYWKSLWGVEAQLNERTESLIREESRKMGNRYLDPIHITKITSFLSKVTVGNFLEMIKYKITVLKHSQLLTGI